MYLDSWMESISNALDAGYCTGTPLLTAEVMQMLQALKANGMGQNDHSGLLKYYEKLTDAKVRRQVI